MEITLATEFWWFKAVSLMAKASSRTGADLNGT